MASDRQRKLSIDAIRLASNAWRWRQVALERYAAGDLVGAEKAIDLAVLAEAAVAGFADSIIDNEIEGKTK